MTTPDTPTDVPSDAAVTEILEALAAQDRGVETLWASGKFVLRSPELPEVYLLRQSSLYYAAPDRLNIIGRKYTKAVVELTAVGEESLLVLPTERQYYDGLEEADAGSVPCVPFSPAQVVREMFFPRPWDPADAGGAERVESAVPELTVLRMPVGGEDGCIREVTLAPSPWRVVGMRILDAGGTVLVDTVRQDYAEQDGLWFPRHVEARFPTEDAFMRFEIAGFDLNVPLERADFDLERQRDDAIAKAFERMVWREQL